MPRTIKISGRDYVTVAERVKEANADKGFHMTSCMTFEVHDRQFVQVTIQVPGDDGQPVQYIGTAEIKFDNAKPGSADATNPMECAETSALGRALGFAGYGVVDGIASADEIIRAQSHQQPHQSAPEARQTPSSAQGYQRTAQPATTTPAPAQPQRGASAAHGVGSPGNTGDTGAHATLDFQQRPAGLDSQQRLRQDLWQGFGTESTDPRALTAAKSTIENFLFEHLQRGVTMEQLKAGEARLTMGELQRLIPLIPKPAPTTAAGR